MKCDERFSDLSMSRMKILLFPLLLFFLAGCHTASYPFSISGSDLPVCSDIPDGLWWTRQPGYPREQWRAISGEFSDLFSRVCGGQPGSYVKQPDLVKAFHKALGTSSLADFNCTISHMNGSPCIRGSVVVQCSCGLESKQHPFGITVNCQPGQGGKPFCMSGCSSANDACSAVLGDIPESAVPKQYLDAPPLQYTLFPKTQLTANTGQQTETEEFQFASLDPAECRKINGKLDKEKYVGRKAFSNARQYCFLELARITGRSDICLELQPDQDAVEACAGTLSAQRSNASGCFFVRRPSDLAQDRGINDPFSFTGCLWSAVAGDPTPEGCRLLEGTLDADPRPSDKCYVNLAKTTNDPSWCGKIVTVNSFIDCVRSVAPEAQRPELCEPLRKAGRPENWARCTAREMTMIQKNIKYFSPDLSSNPKSKAGSQKGVWVTVPDRTRVFAWEPSTKEAKGADPRQWYAVENDDIRGLVERTAVVPYPLPSEPAYVTADSAEIKPHSTGPAGGSRPLTMGHRLEVNTQPGIAADDYFAVAENGVLVGFIPKKDVKVGGAPAEDQVYVSRSSAVITKEPVHGASVDAVLPFGSVVQTPTGRQPKNGFLIVLRDHAIAGYVASADISREKPSKQSVIAAVTSALQSIDNTLAAGTAETGVILYPGDQDLSALSTVLNEDFFLSATDPLPALRPMRPVTAAGSAFVIQPWSVVMSEPDKNGTVLGKIPIGEKVQVKRILGSFALVQTSNLAVRAEHSLLGPFDRLSGSTGPLPVREGYVILNSLDTDRPVSDILLTRARTVVSSGKDDEARALLLASIALKQEDRTVYKQVIQESMSAKRFSLAVFAARLAEWSGKSAGGFDVSVDLFFGCRGNLSNARPVQVEKDRPLLLGADLCATNVYPSGPCQPCEGGHEYTVEYLKKAEASEDGYFGRRIKPVLEAIVRHDGWLADVKKAFPGPHRLRIRIQNTEKASLLPKQPAFVYRYIFTFKDEHATRYLEEGVRQQLTVRPLPLQPIEGRGYAEYWIDVPTYAASAHGIVFAPNKEAAEAMAASSPLPSDNNAFVSGKKSGKMQWEVSTPSQTCICVQQ